MFHLGIDDKNFKVKLNQNFNINTYINVMMKTFLPHHTSPWKEFYYKWHSPRKAKCQNREPSHVICHKCILFLLTE